MESTPSCWKNPGWDEQVQNWIVSALEGRGLALSGPLEEQRARPWSAILRVPTTAGDVYFKATTPELAHEAGLTHYLAELHPEMLLPLLAHDAERGWILMAGGTRLLRDAFKEGETKRVWEVILPEYTRLQVELSRRIDDLLALGVPDRRLERLPGLTRSLLHQTDAMQIGMTDGLSQAEYERLTKSLPLVDELCTRLASYNIPASLDHGDLHDGNIFIEAGRYRYFDWGDGSLTHPFFSMRTTLVSLEIRFELEQDDPYLDHLRDIYLEAWAEYESPERLLEAYALSRRLVPLTAALRWYTALQSCGDMASSGFAYAVPALMQEFLELNP